MKRDEAVRARKLWNEKRLLAQTPVAEPPPGHWSVSAIATPMPACDCTHRRIAHFTPQARRRRVPTGGVPSAWQPALSCSLCDCPEYCAEAS